MYIYTYSVIVLVYFPKSIRTTGKLISGEIVLQNNISRHPLYNKSFHVSDEVARNNLLNMN